jgi:hypothetical protein
MATSELTKPGSDGVPVHFEGRTLMPETEPPELGASHSAAKLQAIVSVEQADRVRCGDGLKNGMEVYMPKLIPMTQPEFDAFLARAIPVYATEHVQAGHWIESEAFEKSQKE